MNKYETSYTLVIKKLPYHNIEYINTVGTHYGEWKYGG